MYGIHNIALNQRFSCFIGNGAWAFQIGNFDQKEDYFGNFWLNKNGSKIYFKEISQDKKRAQLDNHNKA